MGDVWLSLTGRAVSPPFTLRAVSLRYFNVAGADPELAAIEAGAQDFEPADEDGVTLFLTDPTDLDLVSRALPAQGFKVTSASLGYRPKNPMDPARLSAEQLEEVEAFLAALDASEDVQHVYAGLQG